MHWFIIAFISALLSAGAAISQKKVLFKQNALEFSFLLSAFNMVLSIPFFLFFDIGFYTFETLGVLYLKTILGSLAFLCVMLAIKNLDISKALPLLVLTPGVVAFFAFILIGEELSTIEITGMFLLIIGTYILEIRSGESYLKPFTVFIQSKNHYYIIGALLLFAATAILDKVLLVDYKLTPYAFMGFQHIFLAFNFLILTIITRKDPNVIIKSLDKEKLLWILLISVLTIGYRYTQIEAFKIAPVALVLSVKRISVFFATVVGGSIFNEQNLIKRTIATIILITGAILILSN